MQAAVQNYAGEVALRTLLGMSEAMFAGIPLYLTFFYPRDRVGFLCRMISCRLVDSMRERRRFLGSSPRVARLLTRTITSM